jgi:hypothetical protein
MKRVLLLSVLLALGGCASNRPMALHDAGVVMRDTGDAMYDSSPSRRRAADDEAPAPRTMRCSSTWSTGQRGQHPGDTVCRED